MKIYKRADFLKLPIGVIYSKGKRNYFDSFMVKTKNLENDFCYRDLMWFSSENEGDQLNKFDKMIDEGISLPINYAISRDGCFDEEDLFLVYEKEDLKEICKIMQEYIGEL